MLGKFCRSQPALNIFHLEADSVALRIRAVRRRTGGRRRRRVVLWRAAAARRAFFIGGGGVCGVRPDERALKQRTRWTGVFSGFTGVSHFTCDRRWCR